MTTNTFRNNQRSFAIQMLLGFIAQRDTPENGHTPDAAAYAEKTALSLASPRSDTSNSMGKLCLTCGFSNRWLDAEPDGI